MKHPPHPDPPDVQDIKIVDGVFVKMMHFRHAGMVMGQHSHMYDHLSFIASGAVAVRADDRLLGVFEAPASIVIKARIEHQFETLRPATTILCINNADRAEGNDEVALYDLELAGR